MNPIYDAEVTIVFKIKNAVDEACINDYTIDFNMLFDDAGVEIVTEIIDSDGLWGVVEDDFRIVDIKLVPSDT